MRKMLVSGYLATTHPIPVYGGIRLGDEALRQIAEEVRRGAGFWRAHHDIRKPLDIELQVAEVRQMADGRLGLWVEFEVPEDQWTAQGDLRGFSVAVIETRFETEEKDDRPGLSISADAAQFDDETLQAAVAELGERFHVYGSALYQFSELPPAKVIIDFGIDVWEKAALPVLVGLLIEVLKRRFLKPKHSDRTIFNFRIRKNSEEQVLAQLETNDPEVVARAVETLTDLLQTDSKIAEFDSYERRWKALSE